MSNQRALTRFAMPVVAMLAAAALAGCGKQSSVDPELTATLIQPVARLVVQTVKVTPGKRTGTEIYTALCASCHDAGLVGAPKTGDAAAWAPRLALGFDGLTASAIAGKNLMPPRGGGGDLTDTEVKRAVAHLANLAGAKFTEPPIED
ncbi:hypothetical protein M622_05970 [Thauera terpenica 58Eu]|uniref:Cytochrome c domain-containing protein n=1 Tax=Thauera terpenica 58Eu TaxID=1348657 RepID=T0AVB7_9RHOO|nr:c-type cytochrome [Thauera terpenica]EPZ14528.1 hypothetical protein M622_05970 [Thauera terpenica 58Eu]